MSSRCVHLSLAKSTCAAGRGQWSDTAWCSLLLCAHPPGLQTIPCLRLQLHIWHKPGSNTTAITRLIRTSRPPDSDSGSKLQHRSRLPQGAQTLGTNSCQK